MKQNLTAPRFSRQKSGMALISVLAVLFLLTLLVVAFMGRTTGARASAASYRATAETKALSDTVVNLIQAQINEATTQGINADSVGTETWGSQPGAIRTFLTMSGTQGELNRVYRLYSATPADASSARYIDVSTSSSDTAAEAAAMTAMSADLPTSTNWTQYTAQWCDLNAFARDSEGRYHFPILDPRDPGAATDDTANPTTVATLWSPTSGVPALHGISVQVPGAVGDLTNPAPMPLRWLYILKDGSIVSPDSPATASNQLTFINATNVSGTSGGVVSATNPIVGRVAFWTDDESSKINVNTAAGDDVVRKNTYDGTGYGNPYASTSTFWTTPTFSTIDEEFFAYFQPFSGEIQRYPGHPGTVGLNTTLSTLAGLATPMPYADFFSLTPRYTGGGSQSATQPIANQNEQAGAGTSSTTLSLSANRLYTSIGEMLYNPDRTASMLEKDIGSETQAVNAIERSNFFLTAHSSSSELNLSGTPRVSMWPVSALTPTTTYLTPIDQLLMFDATIPQTTASQPDLFYFQRKDSTSSVIDGSIPNNMSVLNYLDQLTSRPQGIPGFGADFSSDKYKNTSAPPATRQILTEIFDYIRTINVLDPVMLTRSTYAHNYTYGQNWGDNAASVVGGYAVAAGNTDTYRCGVGSVQVVPTSNLNKWNTHGVGTLPIPVEVTIDFAALGTGALPPKGLFPATPDKPIPAQQFGYSTVSHDTIPEGYVPPDTTTTPTTPATTAGWDNITPEPDGSGNGKPSDRSTALQAFIYVAFVNPGQMTSSIQPAFAYSMTGLGTLSVSGYLTKSITSYPGPPPVAETPANATIWPAGVQSAHPIYLRFPGNTANSAWNSTTAGSSEQFMINDNSNSAGYLNGDVGDWVFGYVSFIGECGINQYGYSTCNLGPAPTGQKWNNSGSPGYNARAFPYYSQIFGLPGVQGWSSGNGSVNANTLPGTTGLAVVSDNGGPSSVNNKAVFQFNGNDSGSTITLKMYDATHDTQVVSAMDVVTSYQFAFPSTPLLLPTFAASDSQIIGTADVGPYPNNGLASSSGRVTTDRWHQAYAYPTNPSTVYNTMIAQNDTVQSLVLSPTWSDVRDLAMSQVGSSSVTVFGKHPLYGTAVALDGVHITSQAHDLYLDSSHPFVGNLDPANWGHLVANAIYTPGSTDRQSSVGAQNYPVVPPVLNGTTGSGSSGPFGSVAQGAYTGTGAPGDWDNGVAAHVDGPWINLPDEGALMDVNNNNNGSGPINGGTVAYYSTGNNGQKTGMSFSFSPNRQIPSPGMFGSLPTGVNSANPSPWQTLLFRPGSGAGGFGKYHTGEKDQPSAGDPADYLLLDLFWMPQTEPFPISTPFATEGKINLNYEIQPFNYITRTTALRALFNSEEIAVMPDSLAGIYKQPWAANAPGACSTSSIASATLNMDAKGSSRLPIDPDATLGLNPTPSADPHTPGASTTQTGPSAWYDSQLGTTRFFKSAAEICDLFLVPQGYSWADFSGRNFNSHSWYKIPGGDFALVGDNTRERPYTDLYSRLTTKSNTFTVYYTVQALRNAEPKTDSGQQKWDETVGAVVGEYRGSTTLERYLDPNQTLPDYLNTAGATLVSLEPYYKWRVVGTRQFAP